MSVLSMLAAAGAAVGLWTGAAKYSGPVARGYRWLGCGALFWLIGLIISAFLAGPLSASGSLSLADVAPLLALGAIMIGIMVIGSGSSKENSLAGLADGYVLAVALLVICWVAAFGTEFRASGEHPATFLLTLLHPLTDLAVLGATLPVAAVAWRHALLPYLAVAGATASDAIGVGARIAGGREGIAQQLTMIVAACLLATGPWLDTIVSRLAPPLPGRREGGPPGRMLSPGRALASGRMTRAVARAGAAPVIAALAVLVAAAVVVADGLVSGPSSGLALVIAGGAAAAVFAVRVLVLLRESGAATRMWQESGTSLLDLAVRTSDMVLVCDLRGVIRRAGPVASGLTYAEDELAGKSLADFVHPEDLAVGQAAIRQVIAAADLDADAEDADAEDTDADAESRDGGSGDDGAGRDGGADGRFACRVRAADGTWRHIQCAALVYRLPGEPAQLLLTARDVSDQVALRQQVKHLTFNDGLTGLPNRAYVEERTAEALKAADGRLKTAVIFLDLDRFTAVNDLVGHGAGDLVLAQAARRLRAVVPSANTVARWGGDEFAVVVEKTPDAQEVADLAGRLAGTIAGKPFRAADREIGLTASVGVAIADGDSPDLLLRNADVAMSRAKGGGGDRVETYAAHMHADVVRRLDMAADLQRALADGGLTLQYQPVVELATSKVTGAEALVRWWDGSEPVPPQEFLAVAEETGLAGALGEWVLGQACEQAAAWRMAAWDVGVAVNLSMRQLTSAQCAARVKEALAVSGLSAGALTVEISERVLASDTPLVGRRLAELRELGVRVAIDDFGTGYAALAHLRQIPVDIIKIDPSFTAGLGTDPVLTMLTKTITRVGRDLGAEVIAEGIEQPRQLTELREMGCGYGQGFLLARPMAPSGVEAMFRPNPKPGVPAA